jgi:SAM-dependent methyltransferase
VVIHDSSAVRTDGRQLAQHQAALTVLQGLLSAPGLERLAWLDLACGRGQILSGLQDTLSDSARAKIEFLAYDANIEYLRETRKTAAALGFAKASEEIGDLSRLSQLVPAATRFDFVTLTNTVHEVAPAQLSEILADAVLRLSDRGTLFVYDMERVRPPELGAVPFSAHDFQEVSDALIGHLSDNDYRPEVSGWQHSTTRGWNVQIQREYISATNEELEARRGLAITATEHTMREVLKKRLEQCRETLEALTTYGPETAEEQEDREHLLHEFWAITRALEPGA